MKYLIIYLLIGILITTLTIKAMFDDQIYLEKLMYEYKRKPSSIFAACIVVTVVWPYCLLLSIRKSIKRHKK